MINKIIDLTFWMLSICQNVVPFCCHKIHVYIYIYIYIYTPFFIEYGPVRSAVYWWLTCWIYRLSFATILLSSQRVTCGTNKGLRKWLLGRWERVHVLTCKEFYSHSPKALLPIFVVREWPQVALWNIWDSCDQFEWRIFCLKDKVAMSELLIKPWAFHWHKWTMLIY
jgi:hypothetical protein